VTTAEATGTALGSAVAGVAVVHVGVWAPFTLASALLVLPVGVVVAGRAIGRGRAL